MAVFARDFSTAAREVIEYDKATGKPYRVYHELKASHGGTQLHFFVDIEEATRSQMQVSLVNRREQMVSDGLTLTYDQEHRSAAHPTEEPIQLPMDLTFDIELRKNTPDDEEKTGWESPFFQRASAPRRAISERCSGVSRAARAVPPL
jgi:hypothetical protein